ncbi:MAG: hypothetical protein KKG09_07005 [Verrucomicrobia bacterium]|nr:hypothetical protein [Verrucomicrobiota bacterium]MCG2679241.1 hypothetical protein [Kiritimatiellia bacterium]MBU4248635.1 hypothetical protein [Verrucomicrobiota bacterium]MBU4290096.1 hypothetical protein [Verrucomicrobiota bacterium]MBU4429794.1 hypothetical protein [Verrucomicrobiota bacterium]
MKTYAFSRRELYAPGHFGNWYEVAGRFEMRDMLAEAKWWGFNCYSDWFDTVNLTKESRLSSVVSKCWLTKAFWENKKAHFEEAQKLGLKLDLLITPNHVYTDQVTQELLARQKPGEPDRLFGHLLCPSKLKARKIILGNYDDLFKDLAKSKINLDSVTFAAYDFGGCACGKCDPWIVTFAKLSKEIHDIALKYYPHVQLRFCGWWWSPEDHNLFADWADKNIPGTIKGIALWIKYNDDKPANVPQARLPRGCKQDYFFHIGFSDDRSANDTYGRWGPMVAPNRIPRTLETLNNIRGEGFSAYSEGISDDVNKALLAGLSSGKFSTAQEVLEAYAERYFNAKGKFKREWANWIYQWAEPRTVNLKKARLVFDRLASKAPDTWRLDHFASKMRLFELNKQLDRKGAWTAPRLAMAEAFLRERENLRRKIYGLSLLDEPVFGAIVGQSRWYQELMASAALSKKSRHSAEA